MTCFTFNQNKLFRVFIYNRDNTYIHIRVRVDSAVLSFKGRVTRTLQGGAHKKLNCEMYLIKIFTFEVNKLSKYFLFSS